MIGQELRRSTTDRDIGARIGSLKPPFLAGIARVAPSGCLPFWRDRSGGESARGADLGPTAGPGRREVRPRISNVIRTRGGGKRSDPGEGGGSRALTVGPGLVYRSGTTLLGSRVAGRSGRAWAAESTMPRKPPPGPAAPPPAKAPANARRHRPGRRQTRPDPGRPPRRDRPDRQGAGRAAEPPRRDRRPGRPDQAGQGLDVWSSAREDEVVARALGRAGARCPTRPSG